MSFTQPKTWLEPRKYTATPGIRAEGTTEMLIADVSALPPGAVVQVEFPSKAAALLVLDQLESVEVIFSGWNTAYDGYTSRYTVIIRKLLI